MPLPVDKLYQFWDTCPRTGTSSETLDVMVRFHMVPKILKRNSYTCPRTGTSSETFDVMVPKTSNRNSDSKNIDFLWSRKHWTAMVLERIYPLTKHIWL